MTAVRLAQKAAEREAAGTPETLADIIARTRYAAAWKLEQARKCRAEAEGFRKLATVEEYTLQQREDALVAAAACAGEARIHEDTARTLDSIADALVYVVG